MYVAIRKEPTGRIYIDKHLIENVEYTLSPCNFTIVEIDDVYNDCEGCDFNEDLTFSADKYNARKQKESAQIRISELIQSLYDTDHHALKYAEGVISADDYLAMRDLRQSWRDEINALEVRYAIDSKQLQKGVR